MAAPTKASIRKKMESKRQRFLREATTPKEIRFGSDRDVLNFSCWYYYYQYHAWMGNYIPLSDTTYRELYLLFVNGNGYKDMLDGLKEDYSATKSKDVEELIDLARVIRKRYSR